MKAEFTNTGAVKLISENNLEEFAINSLITSNGLEDEGVIIADHTWKNVKVSSSLNEEKALIEKLKIELESAKEEITYLRSKDQKQCKVDRFEKYDYKEQY